MRKTEYQAEFCGKPGSRSSKQRGPAAMETPKSLEVQPVGGRVQERARQAALARQAGGHPGVTTGGHPGVTTGGHPGVTTGGHPGVTTGGHPGVTTGGHPGVTTGGHPGVTAGGHPGVTTGGHPGVTTGGHPGVTTGGHPVIEAPFVAQVFTDAERGTHRMAPNWRDPNFREPRRCETDAWCGPGPRDPPHRPDLYLYRGTAVPAGRTPAHPLAVPDVHKLRYMHNNYMTCDDWY